MIADRKATLETAGDGGAKADCTGTDMNDIPGTDTTPGEANMVNEPGPEIPSAANEPRPKEMASAIMTTPEPAADIVVAHEPLSKVAQGS